MKCCIYSYSEVCRQTFVYTKNGILWALCISASELSLIHVHFHSKHVETFSAKGIWLQKIQFHKSSITEYANQLHTTSCHQMKRSIIVWLCNHLLIPCSVTQECRKYRAMNTSLPRALNVLNDSVSAWKLKSISETDVERKSEDHLKVSSSPNAACLIF